MDESSKIRDDILSYHEMCAAEGGKTIQRGMNFHMSPGYSVILMSQQASAPYVDRILDDGVTIEYEGHDVSSSSFDRSFHPKSVDQQEKLSSGKLTQNGLFIDAINKFKEGKIAPEIVKVYERIKPSIWSFKGYFHLLDYKVVHDGKRNVFRFTLKLTDQKENHTPKEVSLSHTRLIPSWVKVAVWKRDGGKCVLCGDTKNLHYDHDLAYARGGTSLSPENVRILCMKHNLAKSDKIE